MADVFYKHEVWKLLKEKHVVFLGDSNCRAVYKDLICLLTRNALINQSNLKKKQEISFCGDQLGKHSGLYLGREYEEERSYLKNGTRVDFYFITRCYTNVLVDMMEDIHLGSRDAPDVIYINSTLWDVSRWGPNGVTEFKDNLLKLAQLFKSSLPVSTLVIWGTALPMSDKVHSSLLIKQIDFLRHTLRFDVVEANQFARQVMVNHGFDVLDNHFYMRMQMHRRVHDGVHYLPVAVRLLTNLLLTHIALSWDFPLPNRVETILLDKAKGQCAPQPSSPTPQLVSPQFLSNKSKKRKPPPAKTKIENNKQNDYKTPKKRYRGKKNGQLNKNHQQQNQECAMRDSLRRALSRPNRVKGMGSRTWGSVPEDQRGWPGAVTSSSNTHNPGNYIQPWLTPPTNWSKDQWLGGQRFEDNSRNTNKQRFNNDQAFNSEPRFLKNFLQANNTLARMSQLTTRPNFRYAPY